MVTQQNVDLLLNFMLVLNVNSLFQPSVKVFVRFRGPFGFPLFGVFAFRICLGCRALVNRVLRLVKINLRVDSYPQLYEKGSKTMAPFAQKRLLAHLNPEKHAGGRPSEYQPKSIASGDRRDGTGVIACGVRWINQGSTRHYL